MTRKQIAESLWDNSLRIDHTIWLAANSSSVSRHLSDLLEYEPKRIKKLIGQKPPRHASEFEEWICTLSGKGINGYFIQAATPIRYDLGKGMASMSWSACYTEWFYFETWDEAAITTALVAWVDKMGKKPRELEEEEAA
ncbi:MAG: hypothetical protein V4662_11895 [Verrucomicrobiota bacterium]